MTWAPRSRSASGQDVAALAARGRAARWRRGSPASDLDHPLGDGAVRDDVGDDAVLAQRAGGARPHGGDAVAAQRAGVAPLALERGEQLVGAVGGGDDDQVEAGEDRQVGFQRAGADGGRLDDVGAELAQAGGERGRLGAGAGDGDRPAVQRPPRQPLELLAERGDGADDGDRRRGDADLRGPLGDGGEGRVRRALAGDRAALDDRDRLVGGAAAVDQPGADPRQRAHAHVEDERAGEARQRVPVELGAVAGLVAGDERDAGGDVAVRDRDAARRRARRCPR